MKRQGTKVTKKNNETENLKLQLKKYDVINKRVVSRLQPNLTDFREGDFGNIDKETLSGELALILVDNKNFSKTRLGNLDTYNYNPKIFNEFKSICFKILDGLERGLLLDDKNNTLELHVNRCNEILKDKDSIVEYYKERFVGTTSIFGDNEISAQLTVTPILKREYAVYIERHGMPEGFIFDNEILAGIIKELIDAGELDENYRR